MSPSPALATIPPRAPDLHREAPRRAIDIVIILTGYALAFWLCHRFAAIWGTSGYYSLWFPAAGVRFALLWRLGWRWTAGVALTEIAVQFATGVINPAEGGWTMMMWSVARPALAYCAAIALIQRVTGDAAASLSAPPMPFGLAAVSAPVAAVIASLPWAMQRAQSAAVHDLAQVLASLSSFAVGDLLGVLLVAPALLWVDALIRGKAKAPALPALTAVLEAGIVFGSTMSLSIALHRAGLGIQVTPVLLATVWIGLRFGRGAAWCAIILCALIVLPESTHGVALDTSMALNMGLSSVAVAGYLAGSFSDAQVQARETIARRDRLLFQAERLKTLRAMSVAVIHEISQPLSTLAIEARHVAALAQPMGGEIAEGAALVDRKAGALSELVRRLRRFGGRAVDEPAPLPVAQLLVSVRDLLAGEAKASRVRILLSDTSPDLIVRAQEIELAQALVNLGRNAVQATSDGVVAISAIRNGDSAIITVTNRCDPLARRQDGMGIGLMIARTIVEAHDGKLERDRAEHRMTVMLTLPVAEEEGQ